MTRYRRGAILPILLVLAFLAHDAWMVAEHAGHIVYAAADTSTPDAQATGGDTHAGHHGATPAKIVLPGTAELVTLEPAVPPMMMTCLTLRAGTLGQSPGSPGPAVSLAVLPILSDVADQVDVEGRIDWRPPGIPPDVRRAMLQVYRE